MKQTPAFILSLCSLLLWNTLGCSRKPVAESGLSDRQFAELAVEVIHLHRRYADRPDSLTLQREALFQRYGISPEALERFIAKREQHPDAWKQVLQVMEEKLGERGEGLQTGRNRGVGRYRKGEGDTAKVKSE